MTSFYRTDRCCPECQDKAYTFRGRKVVDGTEDEGKLVETKYRCRPCGHEWRERVPAPAGLKWVQPEGAA